MAAGDSPSREPAPAKRAVFLKRFDGVGGATGKIATRGRQQRPEGHLIGTNDENEQRTHEQRVSGPYADSGALVSGADAPATSCRISRAPVASISPPSAAKGAS